MQTKIYVDGMSCRHCEMSITKTISSIAGGDQVETYSNLRFYCPLNGGQSPPTDNTRQGFTSKSLHSSSTYNRLNCYIYKIER